MSDGADEQELAALLRARAEDPGTPWFYRQTYLDFAMSCERIAKWREALENESNTGKTVTFRRV